jgi:Flp pilus assembly protein TadG
MKARSNGGRRRGTVAVVVAVCMVALIGVMAFVLDGGLLIANRRRAQTIADAAAHAAACSLYRNYTTDNGLDPNGTAKAAGLANASANGYTNNGTTSLVAINLPPLSGLFANTKPGYVEAVVTYYQPKYFSAIWGAGTLPVTARAVARVTAGSAGVPTPASKSSLLLLDPSSSGALSLSGSGRVIANSPIQVESSSSSAAIASNAGYASAPSIQVAGGYSTSSSGYFTVTGGNNQVTTSAAAVTDPLASLAAPSTSGLTSQSTQLRGYGSQTINPGIYSGGLTIGGGQTITMNPGTYYMQGGGFNIGNGATVTGSGVLIYLNNGGGQVSFQGGGNITLSPPTSGPYMGMVIYQDRGNSNAISIANGSTSNITGTVYAASAAVNIAGGASASQFGSQFIAESMNVSNNADVRINWSSTDVSETSSVAQGKVVSLVE